MAHGHHAAAQELWSRYGRSLAGYAAAVLRVPGCDASHPAALDAVQSAMLHILHADRRSLERVENVQAFLATSVRNVVLNSIRGGRRYEALKLRIVGGEGDSSGRVSSPNGSGGAASREMLHRALDRLPDDARELLLLKHVANLTLDQMALSLDENRNTLASRVRAAMERLREAMGELDDGNAGAVDRARIPARRGQARP